MSIEYSQPNDVSLTSRSTTWCPKDAHRSSRIRMITKLSTQRIQCNNMSLLLFKDHCQTNLDFSARLNSNLRFNPSLDCDVLWLSIVLYSLPKKDGYVGQPTQVTGVCNRYRTHSTLPYTMLCETRDLRFRPQRPRLTAKKGGIVCMHRLM